MRGALRQAQRPAIINRFSDRRTKIQGTRKKDKGRGKKAQAARLIHGILAVKLLTYHFGLLGEQSLQLLLPPAGGKHLRHFETPMAKHNNLIT